MEKFLHFVVIKKQIYEFFLLFLFNASKKKKSSHTYFLNFYKAMRKENKCISGVMNEHE